jgi:mono/diheme cytochrome c family protein
LSPAQPRPPVQYTPHLAWEADLKAYRANAGETSAHFTFGLTNISSIEVVVNRVTTSCGCTVARLPAQPWRLTPGASGQIDVTVDLRGKWGVLQKFITVDTSDGFKPLRVQVTIPTSTVQPPMVMANRAQNMELARADRQAVFKNDCARCHLQPTVGKVGAALYQAACAICHDSAHRATMVPDLHALTHATDREFWKTWVTSGKAGTLMPAFAMREGGPLTDAQVDSLVNYLAGAFPQRITIIPNRPPPLPPPLPPGPPQAAQ